MSDWESKFLNLQVMQQGTLANLCKSAACRLFIMLPFRSHFVREKSGERDGGEPGRGGGEGRGGRGGGRREEINKNYFLSFLIHLLNHLYIASSSTQFLCSKGKYRRDGKTTTFTP